MWKKWGVCCYILKINIWNSRVWSGIWAAFESWNYQFKGWIRKKGNSNLFVCKNTQMTALWSGWCFMEQSWKVIRLDWWSNGCTLNGWSPEKRSRREGYRPGFFLLLFFSSFNLIFLILVLEINKDAFFFGIQFTGHYSA